MITDRFLNVQEVCFFIILWGVIADHAVRGCVRLPALNQLGSGPAGRPGELKAGVEILLNRNQLDFEDEGAVGRDGASGATLPVGEVRRDKELPF